MFIDSSNVSLKAELPHNVNKFPPVSLAHGANMTESYENTKLRTFGKDPVRKISLKHLWGFKSHCSLTWLHTFMVLSA